MKKAQGISINVIIIAVIALIVLVVIAVVFTGRFTIFSRGVKSCEEKGGICVSYNKAYISAGATCAERTDGRTLSLPGTDCESRFGYGSSTCCV